MPSSIALIRLVLKRLLGPLASSQGQVPVSCGNWGWQLRCFSDPRIVWHFSGERIRTDQARTKSLQFDLQAASIFLLEITPATILRGDEYFDFESESNTMRFRSPLAIVLILLFTAPICSDEIASWSANGNATESVGGRDGTLIGGSGYDSGIVGQAFSLDGTDGYVSVPDDDIWSFGTDPFSLALWINFDTIGMQGSSQLPNTFISHDEGGGNVDKWAFFYDQPQQRLAFHINDPSAASAFITSPTTIDPIVGQWHHVAMTRSGNTYEFFFDGNSVGTSDNSLSIGNANADLRIGQAEGLGFVDGRLDEIKIFNNALSASEVNALASVPEPGFGLALGLLALLTGIRRTRR